MTNRIAYPLLSDIVRYASKLGKFSAFWGDYRVYHKGRLYKVSIIGLCGHISIEVTRII